VNRAYRYPATLRVLGLFGSLLAGSILLGSVLAEVEAADPIDFVLHLLGAVVSAAILWLGLEFGARRITHTAEGIRARLIGERLIAWSDLHEVRDGLLGTWIVLPKHGLPIVIWPFLEDFGTLVESVEAGWTERLS